MLLLSKTDQRIASEKALSDFLARGGSVEIVENTAKIPKSVYRGKATRGGSKGTNGFSKGFSSSSVLGNLYDTKTFNNEYNLEEENKSLFN